MELKLTPQRNDFTVTYAAEEQKLVVTVDGISDEFDFSSAGDGTFEGFTSDVLPFMPLLSATKSGDVISVRAINSYGPQPVQQPDEADEDFAARLADWDKQRTEYEVEI